MLILLYIWFCTSTSYSMSYLSSICTTDINCVLFLSHLISLSFSWFAIYPILLFIFIIGRFKSLSSRLIHSLSPSTFFSSYSFTLSFHFLLVLLIHSLLLLQRLTQSIQSKIQSLHLLNEETLHSVVPRCWEDWAKETGRLGDWGLGWGDWETGDWDEEGRLGDWETGDWDGETGS
jgi:hypothetical protein